MTLSAPHLLRLAAGVAALSFSAGSMAQATGTLLQSSVSLTDLSYQVTDLRPSSGVTPSVIFVNSLDTEPALNATGLADGGAADGDVYPTLRQATWQGLLPSQPLTIQSADGFTTVTATPSGMSASLMVDASVLNKPNVSMFDPEANEVYLSAYGYTGTGPGSTYIQAVDSGPGGDGIALTLGDPTATAYDFILSAHTSVTFKMNVSAQMTFNHGLIPWQTGPADMAQANVSVSLGFAEPSVPLQTNYVSWEAYAADVDRVFGRQRFFASDVNWSDGIDGDATVWNNASNQVATLTLVNDSDEARKGLLNLSVGTTLRLLQSATPAAVVPEPSTYALMGLGLVGLALAKRRARSA